MRLDEVTIGEFKNLRDLRVDFDESSSYTVLVGENGAGKSNLIEALSLIFRNLDLDQEAPFTYHIKYRCRDHDVEVRAQADQHPLFWSKDHSEQEYSELPRKRFMAEDADGRPIYRPAFVFGYYSGPSDRLASIFEKHRERYYSWIIKAPAQRGRKLADPNSLRRLFYAQTLHGQFALIAFFMEMTIASDDDRSFLRDQLQIDGLDSVLFALKRPPWNRKGGDPRFWNAVGEVQEFLSRLYERAMLPIRMGRRIAVDLTKNPTVENLYLFLAQPEALTEVYKSYGNQYAFFTALESTHLSKVLGEVRTRVRMTPAAGGGEVTYRDLSEGEQQLLLVLGLLKFTARDEALFLLDEPDTHLNPAWSTQYLTFLDRFIRGRDSCHIVMSTHDPLVFAGLERAQVQIFRRDDHGRAIAELPDQDPRGMGVAAILTSDLFRLRSTLDPKTQADLDRQRILAMKSALTPAEEEEMRLLKEDLRGRGFDQTIRDPLYHQFLKAWTEHEDPAWRQAVELTPEQREQRAQLAARIVAELRRESGAH
ncbi:MULTISPECIES: AAA family ATPase [unclassified Bradyrhizobium]|uniref:AAA family ATPase n=1 Tax=unclassified Bradyrhizobium TaxID=2631580 RepID=UPI00037445EF|nr:MULTISPECIES: AAA family ATPase [unclassified Bradyrhizobium]MCK1357208.1 AAA family ATPase [Bradyrhizobium sp. CW7]MCK1417410.1 AAA family ATPase [Bradyrhizobium sp. CW4]MCK1425741.1 AAA family ATPase [Bradyrhizobium sp. 87]MCK1577070.1 AAA family ATPase [Bradyrhizobium sp. 174]MCK1710617.1 AAA family ATPase [Bradyrhizobium sp. 143]